MNSAIVDDSGIAEFEAALARHFDIPYCLTVGSCSQAIVVALLACDIGPGKEVILGPVGWGQALAAVLLVGATPIIVDCDQFGGISPATARQAITGKTGAILTVCPNGVADNLQELSRLSRQYGFKLINDASQASRLAGGRAGDICCVSFGPSKLIAAGEGGAIFTWNAKLVEQALLLSQHPLRAAREILDAERFHSISEFFFSFRMSPLHVPIATASLENYKKELVRRMNVTAIVTSFYEKWLMQCGQLHVETPPKERIGDYGRTNMLICPTSGEASCGEIRQRIASDPTVQYPLEPQELSIANKIGSLRGRSGPIYIQRALSRLEVIGSLDNARDYCKRLLSVQMAPVSNKTKRVATSQ